MTSLRPWLNLTEMVAFLDRELKVAAIPDYPGAMNGLQLANEGQVERIVAAVDASLPVIEAAAGGWTGLAHRPSRDVLAGRAAGDRRPSTGN